MINLNVKSPVVKLTLSAACSGTRLLSGEFILLFLDSPICWRHNKNLSLFYEANLKPNTRIHTNLDLFNHSHATTVTLVFRRFIKGRNSGTSWTADKSSYLGFIQKGLNSLSGLLLSSLSPLSWRDNFRPVNQNTPTLQAVTEVLKLSCFNLKTQNLKKKKKKIFT